MRSLRTRRTLAIVTAKDRASVRALLTAHGFTGLIEDNLLLDKETGVYKTAHLEELRRRTHTEFTWMTFADEPVGPRSASRPRDGHS